MIPQHFKKNIEAKVFFEILKKDFMLDKSFKHDELSLEDKNELHHYIVELFNLHKKKYYKNRDFEEFNLNYSKLNSLYKSFINWTILYDYIIILIEDGQVEKAYDEWMLNKNWGESSIEMLIIFEKAFNKSMVGGKHIYNIAPRKNQLTEFGLRNLEEVFDIISLNIQTLYENSFFEVFYKDYKSFKAKKLTYPFEHYIRFFQHNESAKKLWEWYCSDEGVKNGRGRMYDGNASQDFVKIAIKEECSRLLRDAENLYRNKIGAKNIGEAWISETELFYKLKNHFIEFEVVQHGRPDWLGRQHVDIWFPDYKIGIEYQGQQHDRPIEFFGGEKSFEENKKRDERKRMLFKENNAFLIEVREGFDFEILCEDIKSFIYK